MYRQTVLMYSVSGNRLRPALVVVDDARAAAIQPHGEVRKPPALSFWSGSAHCGERVGVEPARGRERDDRAGSLAGRAFEAQVAAVQPRQAARQGQAEARAVELAVQRRVHLHERLQHALEIALRDADAVVAD